MNTTPQRHTPPTPATPRSGGSSYLLLSSLAACAAMALTACGPGDGTAQAAAPTLPPGYVAVPAAEAAKLAKLQAEPTAAPVRVAQAQPRYVANEPRESRPAAAANVGRVRGIEPIHTRPQGSGAGAVIGGVLGGVLGNQIGKGDGRTAATAIGAVGGAVAGNNVERNQKSGITGYRVRVEFDNGDSRTYEESSVSDLRVGDRVRIESGHVRRS